MSRIAAAKELLVLAKALTADEETARLYVAGLEKLRSELALFSGHVEEVVSANKRSGLARRDFDKYEFGKYTQLMRVIGKIEKARELFDRDANV